MEGRAAHHDGGAGAGVAPRQVLCAGGRGARQRVRVGDQGARSCRVEGPAHPHVPITAPYQPTHLEHRRRDGDVRPRA